MKKITTLPLVVFLLPVLLTSCKGNSGANTADSTTLYTGSTSKLDSIAAKNKTENDSLRIGPDSFNADSTKKAAHQ